MAKSEVTQAQIEQSTDAKFVDSHTCSLNLVPGGTFVLRADEHSAYPEPAWVLVNVWQADEGDVAMGEAEFVGEISQVSVISVAYCPFCGKQLLDDG